MKCRRILAAGGLFLLLLGGSACTPEMPEPDPSETSASVETQAVLSDTGEGGFSVYTDWSKLEVYQPPEEQYTRWYHEAVHELLPLEDGYGTLVPFVGSFPPDRSWGGVYQYGLMTMDGAIVVDTTYSDVWRMTYYEGGVQRLPVLGLMETVYEGPTDGGYHIGIQRFGAAALDGSWAIPVEYTDVSVLSAEYFALWQGETAYVYNLDGQLLRSMVCSEADLLRNTVYVTWNEGMSGACREDGASYLIDLFAGRTIPLAEGLSVYWPMGELFLVRDRQTELYGAVDRAGRLVIPTEYRNISEYRGGAVQAEGPDGTLRYFDAQGQEVPEPEQPEPSERPQPPDRGLESFQDCYTGETYYLDIGGDGYDVLDSSGRVLTHLEVMNDAGTQNKAVINGLVLVLDDLTAGYQDLDGNWVFRIYLAEAGDD